MLKAVGPDAVAARFRDARLLYTRFGFQAIERLGECFSSPAHTGPRGWLEESGFEDDEAAREARDAVALVGEFIAGVRK